MVTPKLSVKRAAVLAAHQLDIDGLYGTARTWPWRPRSRSFPSFLTNNSPRLCTSCLFLGRVPTP